uniref:Glycylpeptide N-tetradecanoyltransferase n=1 Tax=Lygus hesperus TaxID=30085 RepID=A0A0A9WFP2_LYGHE
MGMTQSRNFAPAAVVASSLLAYIRVPKKRIYARAAYRLYMLTGILHLVSGYFGFEESLQKPMEIAFTWSYALGLPLLAAEVCCVNGVFSGIATLHIIVPVATLIIYHYDVNQLDVYLLGYRTATACSLWLPVEF